MQNETIKANGKRVSLTPNCDACLLDLDSPRLSVEYARARDAINEDFKLNFAMNQPMAKNIRKRSKRAVIEAMKGKVSKKTVTKNDKTKDLLIVVFPDNSIANL